MARTYVRVTQRGRDELRRRVDARMVHPITDAVADDMRRLVPVLSGDLRSTIHAVHLEGEGRVYFGAPSRGINYHFYVEFGTWKMAAQPYARPALYRVRSL
jgi:hypothetical protein